VLLSFVAVNTQAQNTCAVCQVVVTTVEKMIASNATETEIIQTVDQICTLLDSSDCYAFIAQYIPDLIQWIEDNEQPLEFCTAVGVCTPPPPPQKPGRKLENVKMISL